MKNSMAAGKTMRQLQEEIHDRYVPKYYRIMTPSVETRDRFFSVGGEVKARQSLCLDARHDGFARH